MRASARRRPLLDTPLGESAIVGIAIGGQPLNGSSPSPEIQFADFIHPAFDQIVSEAGAHGGTDRMATGRCRSSSATPFGGGVQRRVVSTRKSIEAFYAHVPGLKGGRAEHAGGRATGS